MIQCADLTRLDARIISYMDLTEEEIDIENHSTWYNADIKALWYTDSNEWLELSGHEKRSLELLFVFSGCDQRGTLTMRHSVVGVIYRHGR